jgi:hypothetical protein
VRKAARYVSGVEACQNGVGSRTRSSSARRSSPASYRRARAVRVGMHATRRGAGDQLRPGVVAFGRCGDHVVGEHRAKRIEQIVGLASGHVTEPRTDAVDLWAGRIKRAVLQDVQTRLELNRHERISAGEVEVAQRRAVRRQCPARVEFRGPGRRGERRDRVAGVGALGQRQRDRAARAAGRRSLHRLVGQARDEPSRAARQRRTAAPVNAKREARQTAILLGAECRVARKGQARGVAARDGPGQSARASAPPFRSWRWRSGRKGRGG